MQIASSHILMSSTHVSSSSHTLEERLRAWKGGRRPDFEAVERGDGQAALRAITRDSVELSERARSAATRALDATSEAPAAKPSDPLSPQDRATIRLLEQLWEQVIGRKIRLKVLHFDDTANDGQAQAAAEQLQQAANHAQATRQGNDRAGWGIEYDRVEHHEEAERTTFSTTGVVRTTDGKEIAVSVNLRMSRELVTHTEEHLRLGDAVRKDPLVINFGGTAAQLTTDKFSFDLDADGAADQISFVKSGSGFLALDKNGDGTVNDGRELFGPDTGDGFAELAGYDGDGNHWIDEGDAVFNRLRVWTKGAQADQLFALGQVGVGAIYLGHAATPFSVNDASNQQLGLVQSTGTWLGEKGGAGTLQHLDLVV